MKHTISESWREYLRHETESDYFNRLTAFVEAEYADETVRIFPPKEQIFEAFRMCDVDKVKVVILGQDPYHEVDQAHGLAFSVNEGVRIPPSLRNIFKEIASDIGITPPDNGCLVRWAEQGVLLLNATLTVREHTAGSHQKRGWETFTDNVIARLSETHDNLVFMLWGAYAQKKESLIDTDKHLILSTVHPSPLSARRGFFGCKHFSRANEYLKQNNKDEIAW
jgi:uracil-DNA glycosylase